MSTWVSIALHAFNILFSGLAVLTGHAWSPLASILIVAISGFFLGLLAGEHFAQPEPTP